MKIRKATTEDFDEVLKLKLESKEEERKFSKELQPVKKVKKNYFQNLLNLHLHQQLMDNII